MRFFCGQVHWFSIANSLLIVLFLTGMIAMILIRNLCRDITRYNRVPTEEERAEERCVSQVLMPYRPWEQLLAGEPYMPCDPF